MDDKQDKKIQKEAESYVQGPANGPFGGFGVPFSGDPLANPNPPNPTSDTKPYAGEIDYSINNVGPYAPPGAGEDNPAQTIDTVYAPPGSPEAEARLRAKEEEEQRVAAVYSGWDNKQWFDGTSSSIYDRIIEGEELVKKAKAEGDYVTWSLINEQIKVLADVAHEFDDSALVDYVSNLPGGTVAMEYNDLVDGGLVDVNSWLDVTAHKMQEEVASYDWNKFAVEGAQQWVGDKVVDNPEILQYEGITREAAVDYIKNKTMVLMDPVKRAEVIDEFIGNVERARRIASAHVAKTSKEKNDRKKIVEASLTRRAIADLNDEVQLDKEVPTYDGSGILDIGEDDGSFLYSEAKQIIESNAGRDWAKFTTAGAREWFFDNTDHTMNKYADITKKAAEDYAYQETELVHDEMVRNEIIRAFTSSVEYLRDKQYRKQAQEEHPEVEPEEDFDEIFGPEVLW